MGEANLTIRQAYLAMYEFLDKVYSQTKSDELAVLLDGMSLLADDGTADPAVWEDWLKCVRKVLH